MSNEKQVIRLYGGHRNDVFETDGMVKIVWRDGLKRREQIREGVLLENFIATHTNIIARSLVNKSKPFQQEDGKLVTYFHFAPGEIRYPWNTEEIASAAKLLQKLHEKVGPWNSSRSDLIRQLHLDFARGNVLFSAGTETAAGVIDFETTARGPIEQELGRSLSFILVDSPQQTILKKRMNSFLTNYRLPFRKDEVMEWTRRYLTNEEYGDRNSVRDNVLLWLKKI